jgi:hypothetical protein
MNENKVVESTTDAGVSGISPETDGADYPPPPAEEDPLVVELSERLSELVLETARLTSAIELLESPEPPKVDDLKLALKDVTEEREVLVYLLSIEDPEARMTEFERIRDGRGATAMNDETADEMVSAEDTPSDLEAGDYPIEPSER